MNTLRNVDLIIEARWIIPVEPANTTLEHHAVVIDKGLIADLLPIHKSHECYTATEIVELPEHVLLPGLINAHTHAAMSLLRGIADDLPLTPWLQDAIWPMEQKLVSSQFVYDGTSLAAAEMLCGGITCASDMYFFPDDAARAFSDAGMRAALGITIIDFPSNYATTADDYLHKGLQARENWKENPLINFALAPHAPYTVSNQSFERIATLAEELDTGIHIHIHETTQEIRGSLAQHGVRPLARLDGLGLIGPNSQLVHAVYLTECEQQLIAARNCSVIHNPTSNMKLASGIAPVNSMLAQGINVALGTDGAASNNRLDIFQEMRHAALLAKVTSGDASALPAHQVIRMATLNGAQSLGLQEQIGSIQHGKEADLCAVSLGSPQNTPCYDPASHLVYVAGRESVTDVWVQGKPRVRTGSLLHASNKELLSISRLWQNATKR
ncbi:TRZ/ATZ family hydrolase [Uliginosibacterium flavum]|uniref:5-methylthioadenosine/S-adenosylhomocysteine deaminase n=1 Tax=Uliginosibacterium flavum TaxID=1396831 RepID=A0ABV2TFG5_9RHOO